MQADEGSTRYMWLRILLGAIVTVAVVAGLTASLYRLYTYWTPPAVVQVPSSPPVRMNLADHPRLCVTAEAIEAFSEAKESVQYLRIMARADEFYGEYLVDPLMGDTIYPGYFALAWRISGEERYLDAARDMVLTHCRFPRWLRRPESANFYKIELGYAVGLAYDLLYDQFSEAERRGIEEDLSEVLDGLLWHIQGNPNRPFWYDAPHSNYYVAQHSAAGLLAVCLGDAYTGVSGWENALAFAYEGLQPSLELFENDGGWIEGLTYQDFCWGQHGIFFLNALRLNGGPNRLDEEWYGTSVRFALSGILPSGTRQVNFGDNISDPIACYGYLMRARAFFDSEFLDEYLDRYMPEPDYPLVPLDSILMEAMLAFDPGLPLQDFPEPEPCQYFSGIEWTMLREDWENPDGFYLASKAGYGGWDHNHIDQGTFILAFDGEQYIEDAGRGDFNDRKDPELNYIYGGPGGHSVYHPDPAGDEWADFTMYSENAEHHQADAVISDWEDNERYTSFRMVLDGSYPASGDVEWDRNIVWVKPMAELPGGAVLVLDSVNTDGGVGFVTRMEAAPRREGFILTHPEPGTGELGVFTVPFTLNTFHSFELLPELNNFSVVPEQEPGEEGNNRYALTVLLPRDDIARVVCEVPETDDGLAVFVDGFLFEFIRNEEGNRIFNQ